MEGLQDACTVWQSGMEGGSSPIRAAARNLTGVRHYFASDFITAFEDEARNNPVTTGRARVLLEALAASPRRTASEWGSALGVDSDWVGRGIKRGAQDDQILAALQTGSLTMPLWGASFDRQVAAKYGERFTFVLEGEFPAIPAWVHSGVVAEELELICGGRYEIVEPLELAKERVEVHLRFVGGTPLR